MPFLAGAERTQHLAEIQRRHVEHTPPRFRPLFPFGLADELFQLCKFTCGELRDGASISASVLMAVNIARLAGEAQAPGRCESSVEPSLRQISRIENRKDLRLLLHRSVGREERIDSSRSLAAFP